MLDKQPRRRGWNLITLIKPFKEHGPRASGIRDPWSVILVILAPQGYISCWWRRRIINQLTSWISGGSPSAPYLLFTVPAGRSRFQFRSAWKIGIDGGAARRVGTQEVARVWMPINASLASAYAFVPVFMIPISGSNNWRTYPVAPTHVVVVVLSGRTCPG